MATPAITDPTCGVFGKLAALLPPRSLHRFIVGVDSEPKSLEGAKIGQQLGDPFATLVLAKGSFPQTAIGALEAVDKATSDTDPLRKQMSFVLGEGSQIPFSAETASVNRNFRFLVTRGEGADGPDLIVSAFFPDQEDEIELMAWDAKAGGFNFYRSVGKEGAWLLAGNSRQAIEEPSEGKGPYESHASGNFLMKELRAPWINWHSPDANIFETAFADADRRRKHPWFADKVPQGALVCEAAVARPAIKRWVRARFEQDIVADGTVARPARIVRQLLETPTVNLLSSHTEGQQAASAPSVDLPQTFFIDSEALSEVLGLAAPPTFAVAGALYGQSLKTFDVKLDDEDGFTAPGDTHFAFVVPERASEDQEVLNKAIEVGLITDRLAACLLMTDFPNPVFSARRAVLMSHVPESAKVVGGKSEFSQQTADAIVGAAPNTPEGSPERQFAERWGVGDGWKDAFNALLGQYYTAVSGQLQSQAGFDNYFRLAESRRNQVRQMPIFESPLLFAHTNIPPADRAMQADGTVKETADS